jgi:hypothetical protein
MREILFRGKTKDGRWIYGDLWHRPYGNNSVAIVSFTEDTGTTGGLEVIPETVGQYTGLKDKNGVEIYEGDILHRESHWGWYVGFENGAFRRIPLNCIQRINWKHYTLQQAGLDTWEVIGNIYENPELLEEINAK